MPARTEARGLTSDVMLSVDVLNGITYLGGLSTKEASEGNKFISMLPVQEPGTMGPSTLCLVKSLLFQWVFSLSFTTISASLGTFNYKSIGNLVERGHR